MKILTGTAIKQADLYTILKEPISSVDLMERAATTIAHYFLENIDKKHPLLFFIGKGNNGGDGLAVARILYHLGYECAVFLPFDQEQLSADGQLNLHRLPGGVLQKSVEELASVSEATFFVDALLGTGVRGQVSEPIRTLIERINAAKNRTIAIDLPSGMKSEFDNNPQAIVQADITLTLEFPKLAMLFPEAGECCGEIIVLPIGLNKDFIQEADSDFYFVSPKLIKTLKRKRLKFAHKGSYGHALLICGSRAMMGAAVLAAGAAVRSGCGLLTIHLPFEERLSLQTRCPSALLSLDAKSCFSELPTDINKYNTVGIGCGLGQSADTIVAFEKLLRSYQKPILIDADALNILALRRDLLQLIPFGSILTPHPKELERLVGKWTNEEDKIKLVRNLAEQRNVVVVLKGAHSLICLPSGRCYFNSTGNSGMAKAGSGDVLSGLITGLLARGYSSEEAAILGVYYHGLSGDRAAEQRGRESINSEDLIHFLQLDNLVE